MSRRRFFVPEIRRGFAELTGADAEHLVRVLRVEVGQKFEIADNQHVYLAQVDAARKSTVVFRVTESLPDPPAGINIFLAAALIKFDRFEWLIEKATELGVTKLLPFEATRTEHGLAMASKKRIARWEKIALEASQQSRRFHLPTIEATVRLSEILKTESKIRVFLDENVAAPPLLSQLPKHLSVTDDALLILGPEGGWTDVEREQVLAAGFSPCSLGSLILRAETAAMAAIAIVGAVWSESTKLLE